MKKFLIIAAVAVSAAAFAGCSRSTPCGSSESTCDKAPTTSSSDCGSCDR